MQPRLFLHGLSALMSYMLDPSAVLIHLSQNFISGFLECLFA